jgi:Family of unknown function (DUF6516)
LLLRRRFNVSAISFVEMMAWRVPQSVKGSSHLFKYRFAFVSNEIRVLRYDNEAGKGDHRHVEDRGEPYVFVGLDALVRDFLADVAKCKL